MTGGEEFLSFSSTKPSDHESSKDVIFSDNIINNPAHSGTDGGDIMPLGHGTNDEPSCPWGWLFGGA